MAVHPVGILLVSATSYLPPMSRALARLEILETCQDVSRYVSEPPRYYGDATYPEMPDVPRCGLYTGLGLLG